MSVAEAYDAIFPGEGCRFVVDVVPPPPLPLSGRAVRAAGDPETPSCSEGSPAPARCTPLADTGGPPRLPRVGTLVAVLDPNAADAGRSSAGRLAAIRVYTADLCAALCTEPLEDEPTPAIAPAPAPDPAPEPDPEPADPVRAPAASLADDPREFPARDDAVPVPVPVPVPVSSLP